MNLSVKIFIALGTYAGGTDDVSRKEMGEENVRIGNAKPPRDRFTACLLGGFVGFIEDYLSFNFFTLSP